MGSARTPQNFLKKALDWSEIVLRYIGMVLVVAMTGLVFFNVITRYVFRFTLGWSDEVALLFMIWFVYIGIAIGVKESIHLSLAFLMNLLPSKYQVWVSRLGNVLVGLFGWFMLKYGLQLYNASQRTRLPATQWSRSLLSVMVPIAGAFVIIYSLAHLLQVFSADQENISTVDGEGQSAHGEVD